MSVQIYFEKVVNRIRKNQVTLLRRFTMEFYKGISNIYVIATFRGTPVYLFTSIELLWSFIKLMGSKLWNLFSQEIILSRR